MNSSLQKRIVQISSSIEHPNQVGKSPLVSVLIVTYNQEDTIAQCLDSILAQKTNFNFEILLGEDNSQDSTRDICIRFAQKYPTKIRLFAHTGDDKIFIYDKPSGRFNGLSNIINARGKYLAFCEGDDYWNGSEKLQRQVDALEADQSIGLCFHSVYIDHFGKIFKDKDDFTNKIFEKIPDKSNITYKTLLEFGNFIHTPSAMCRKDGLIEALSQLNTHPPALDYVMHIIASSQKRVHKLDGYYATYRPGIGLWSSTPKWEIILKSRGVLKAILDLEFLDKIDRQIILDKLDSVDQNLLRVMQNWTLWDHLKHVVKSTIIMRPRLKRIFLAYRKLRH